jgi:hypothetical protein
MTGRDQFGPIEMGGTFTGQTREGPTPSDQDPDYYKHPPGSVA